MVTITSLLLTGLFLQAATVPHVAPAPASQAPPSQDYIVGPGDVLEITVLDQADLTRSTTVQSDGRLSMPLLGDVEVAGKSVAEIQRTIADRLAKDFLVNPQVEVRVREYASQAALVLGEVLNPGRRALRGNTRLIDILIESGGFRPTFSGEIIIQRTNGTLPNGNKTLRFHLGASTGMAEADRLNAEIVLANGDIITAAPKYYVTVDGEVSRPGRVLIENDL
ncbi:MAG: polysaccharide biosynthesis/export family protein, partial [Vicinamibacteria bacterium]